jgi:hypothetical protein
MMTSDNAQQFDDRLAKIISAIYHPLFMPVYGLLIIFAAPSMFAYLPFLVKKWLFVIVLINNVLIPLSLIPYFRFRNIITSWSVENRKERIIPLITTSFFYTITVYLTLRFHIPLFIKSFILASTFLAIAATIINFWWKISLHSAGAGALTALVIVLSVKMHTPLTWFMIIVILSAGLVMTSRLWLNSHTPWEVWTGFFLGACGTSLFLILF